MDFSAYRTAVRTRADELAVAFPSGFCTVISDDNSIKGSVAGVKTECSVFNAAKHEIDGTGHAVVPTVEVQ